MSLNFDVDSNLSCKKVLHYGEKSKECVNFILILFFLQPTVGTTCIRCIFSESFTKP
jgi:hypothetical protein